MSLLGLTRYQVDGVRLGPTDPAPVFKAGYDALHGSLALRGSGVKRSQKRAPPSHSPADIGNQLFRLMTGETASVHQFDCFNLTFDPTLHQAISDFGTRITSAPSFRSKIQRPFSREA